MITEREKVIAVIKDYTDALQTREAVARGRDGATVSQALRDACERSGLSVESFRETIAADASLTQLEDQALSQAMSGTTDPGPNDAVSRESPSGQPGDLDKSRTMS